VLCEFYKTLPPGKFPVELNVPWDSQHIPFDVEAILRHIQALSMDTGPGFPFCFLHKTKQDVVEKDLPLLVSCVLGRLKLYNRIDYQELLRLEPTPSELVLWGLSDPVRVFVKNEPTKTKKIGLCERIINSVSIIQIVVEMYLMKDVDMPKKQNWFKGPGSVGIGFTDTMASQFQSSINESFVEASPLDLPRAFICTDVKSMDYSQSEDVIELSVLQKVTTNAAECTAWSKYLVLNAFVLARPLYVLSDGTFVSQVIPGGRRSGELDTSEGNTASKASLTILCAFAHGKVRVNPFLAPVQRAQGDDGVHQPFCTDEEYKKFHSDFGMTITGFEIGTPEDFLFCSQRWKDGKCIPQNIVKQLYNLLSNPQYDWDLLSQYCIEHRNDPTLKEQLDVIEACWPGCPSYPIAGVHDLNISTMFSSDD